MGHALLSASSSKRWLNCPPSARLSENYEDKTSDFALEGSCAHELAEFRLKEALGMEAENPIENLSFYNEEMEEHVAGYVNYIMEIVEEERKTCPDVIVLVEQRLDYSRFVAEGFGTGDAIVIADGTLHIIDLKYGRGVSVSAEDNPQMKLYSLGALEIFDSLYDINKVDMTIYQPRLANVSNWEIPVKDLYEWAENILKPTAELAFKGEGQYHCGEWCQFCKAKSECRERAEENLRLVQYSFAIPPLLSDDEIAEILAKVDELVSWANDIKEFALSEALKGKEWEGWKLVEGTSRRKYTDEDKVAEVVLAAGEDPYEQKVLGISAMEKRLGKAKFNQLLSSLVIKPQGKPSLVPESTNKPAWRSVDKMFNEIGGEK